MVGYAQCERMGIPKEPLFVCWELSDVALVETYKDYSQIRKRNPGIRNILVDKDSPDSPANMVT
jgi:hypothetical protein